MRISDLIKMGLRNLSRRKARTALTVVGVIIGTISIVVMISIGVGMNTTFTNQVMQLGSLTTITMNKNEYIQNSQNEYVEKKQEINDKLVNTIREIEHVKCVIPFYSSGNLSLSSGKYQGGVSVQAFDYNYIDEMDFPSSSYGELPTAEEKGKFIIGSDGVRLYNPNSRYGEQKEFEPGRDRIQYYLESYEYQRENYEEKPKQFPMKEYTVLQSTNSYDGTDWSIFMDINEYRKAFKEYIKLLKKTDQKKAMKSLNGYDSLKIIVDNVKYVTEVQDQLKEMDYQTSSLTSMFETTQQTSQMLQMVLGAVGAVAMLVSAINIANTMIMSIYERTKEIGIMKVLGCIITDIKKLFLFEAGMIGLIGGTIGIIVSYIASYCINKFGAPIFEKLMAAGSLGDSFFGAETASKFSIIPIWLPLLAAGFAIFIGLISGYYPASRATKISAIEAMKSE